MSEVAAILGATPRRERPVLLGIDGVDGSGKTTFARALADAYLAEEREVHVVHLDDFLNPRSIRYRSGRGSPDGFFLDTYDLASFARNVLEPLQPGGSRVIVPRAFDHREDRPVPADPVTVRLGAVVIVEGMFLHRDELYRRWDLSVFLDVPFAVSVARLAARDGTSPDPDDPSIHRYVQGQRRYLSDCAPAQRATYRIDNS